MTMDQGAYGNHVITTNQRNGGRLSTKSTKAAKLKGTRPNFVMTKDSKSAVQDATKLLQMDSLSHNNMLAMQQFRMPTPTEQDASKIMAGQELKSVNQRQLVGGKQQYPLASSVPKSIHSAQPLNNKKHSLEHTRNNQSHMDPTNLSEFHAAEHSRHMSKFMANQQTPIDFQKQYEQYGSQGHVPSGGSGGKPAKGVRRKSQRPERASIGVVESRSGEGCVVSGEKPAFYQHPFS